MNSSGKRPMAHSPRGFKEGGVMTVYSLELKVWPTDKSEYRPTHHLKMTGQREQQIAEALITCGVLIKDGAMPERGPDGKFLPKEGL